MKRRILNKGMLLTFLVLLSVSALYDLNLWKLQQGERLLATGDAKGALTVWSGRIMIISDQSRMAFNQGVARYRLGEFDQAVGEFQVALAAKDRMQRQAALYNLGTTHLQMGKNLQERDRNIAVRHADEAVRWLGEARALKPDDADVRENEAAARTLLATLEATMKALLKKDTTPEKKAEASRQNAVAGKNEKNDKLSSKQRSAGKPGQSTDAENGEGKRRKGPDMSHVDAIRFLDDARGREMLRSTVAVDAKQGKTTSPEKDW